MRPSLYDYADCLRVYLEHEEELTDAEIRILDLVVRTAAANKHVTDVELQRARAIVRKYSGERSHE